MKKSIMLGFAAALVPFFFTSCASTKISLKEYSPVAVISIVGNTQVPWVDAEAEDGTATGEPEAENLLTSMVNKLVNGQNPEIVTAVDRLDYAFDSVNQNFPELIGLEVLPKDTVISADYYDSLHSSYFNLLAATKKATGFKDLSTIGAKSARYLLEAVGGKSALLLSFTFQKDVAKGSRSNGTIVGIVTMKAKLLNSRGKEILNKIYTAKTAEPIKIKRSEYDTDSLLTGLEEAIDSAVRQLCMEISKMSYDSIDEATETKEENSVKATAIALPVRTKTADADAPAESVSPAESAEVNP
ncbi:MAG: hypothetical protein IJ158_01820 [Treponema sp.]|nr:hypothetical protein [Treponema sp.]